MGELDNCTNCGNLFVRLNRSICQDCFKEEEKKFQTVYEFMKKRVNRQATIPEITEATGVEEELIIKFVKEKRLRAAQFPNLTYPCEKCGAEINDGKLCSDCSAAFSADLKHQSELERINKENQAKKEKVANTYYAVDRVKKKD